MSNPQRNALLVGGSNPRPSEYQAEAHSTELSGPASMNVRRDDRDYRMLNTVHRAHDPASLAKSGMIYIICL